MRKYPVIVHHKKNNNKCLLIYIVEPLLIEGGEYAHTNQREIVELVSCLNGREFTVDVVDFRDNWHLKKWIGIITKW